MAVPKNKRYKQVVRSRRFDQKNKLITKRNLIFSKFKNYLSKLWSSKKNILVYSKSIKQITYNKYIANMNFLSLSKFSHFELLYFNSLLLNNKQKFNKNIKINN